MDGRERYVVGHNRLGQSLEGERADFFERCRPFDHDGDTLSDEDLPVLGLSAKPRGEIAHGADCGIARAFREADLANAQRDSLGPAKLVRWVPCMQRREAVAILAGAAVAWPLAARGQQKTIPVIGILGSSSPRLLQPAVVELRRGLSETGYVEGQNLAIEYRWAEGHKDRLPALAADLVGRKIDVIATNGGASSALAAKAATSTIPVVFVAADPVGAGLVASLARPGGNLTGFSILSSALTPKRLELLSELVPQARLIALLVNPNSPSAESIIRDMQEAARGKGLQLTIINAGTESEINTAFTTLVSLHAGALIVAADPFLFSRREQLVALAAHYPSPAIFVEREFAVAGGLISYGTSFAAVFHQQGIYVGKILKGANPADLPVQQPTKFELVINLKTAKALGLAVPQSILVRADEVIE